MTLCATGITPETCFFDDGSGIALLATVQVATREDAAAKAESEFEPLVDDVDEPPTPSREIERPSPGIGAVVAALDRLRVAVYVATVALVIAQLLVF
jgi:hypothetical protein